MGAADRDFGGYSDHGIRFWNRRERSGSVYTAQADRYGDTDTDAHTDAHANSQAKLYHKLHHKLYHNVRINLHIGADIKAGTCSDDRPHRSRGSNRWCLG